MDAVQQEETAKVAVDDIGEPKPSTRMRMFSVLIKPEHYSLVEKIAKQEYRTVTSLTRKIIVEYLQGHSYIDNDEQVIDD